MNLLDFNSVKSAAAIADPSIGNLRMACTGFVSEQAGSVASANALLLCALLDAGLEIDFFSKPSFVDPRPAVGQRPRFRFVPVVNRRSDAFRRRVERVPILGPLAGRNDAATYNRLLVRRIGEEHGQRAYDGILWMGDYAHGAVPGVPTISFAQGPPGTDARSFLRRGAEIRRLAGWSSAAKWAALARLRLSRIGLPQFRHSDHFIVGSSFSRECLATIYGLARDRISTLPYPIDLELFSPRPGMATVPPKSGPLRLLWLGRIIPRKRLDLFLEGTALAVRQGLDITLTIVGGIGLVKGYEKLILEFPFPERLRWIESLPRAEIPELLRAHDVLAQPSEDENFGSSVAEAQACGLPVVVGHLNGNADYLCVRDRRLADAHPRTFAAALTELFENRRVEALKDFGLSRSLAERKFSTETVGMQLVDILGAVCRKRV
jgi:glycosyltransferase involved in cell wall biosynthesis